MHSAAAKTLGAFVVCFGSFAVAPSPTLAEVWPERGVKIITSFPAGTGGDLSARLYAERLALRWGKPVIVENKPGADGILAVTAVIGTRDIRFSIPMAVRSRPTRLTTTICPMTPCAISSRYP